MFNNSSNLYDSKWLALVFANRNQNYGAYQLRKESSNNTMKAFFIAAPLFVGVFFAPSVIAALKSPDQVINDPIVKVVEFDQVHEMKKKEEPKKAETEPQKQEAPKSIQAQAKTVALPSNITVVKDELVSTLPPKATDLDEAVIASTTVEGIGTKGNADIGTGGVTGGEGIGVGGNGTSGNDVKDLAGVDVYPEFPGGMEAWSKYIQRNLRYPSMAQEEGIGGKVFLSFVVEKDGTITDVKVVKGIGYGCDEEATRVIKKSPRWKAGMQNNLPVRVRYNIPINYTISN
ncbi:energy transducer TonB [Nubsella zeaxanthinifaciens]|uniref:energy transducer TonB n=1 Tax=Nubsella zeaxanthinifaciens TaxID=392412 RepID=UPI003CFDDD14